MNRRRTIWTFLITSTALFMGSLDNLVVTTALPSIRQHLHRHWPGCNGLSTLTPSPLRSCY